MSIRTSSIRVVGGLVLASLPAAWVAHAHQATPPLLSTSSPAPAAPRHTRPPAAAQLGVEERAIRGDARREIVAGILAETPPRKGAPVAERRKECVARCMAPGRLLWVVEGALATDRRRLLGRATTRPREVLLFDTADGGKSHAGVLGAVYAIGTSRSATSCSYAVGALTVGTGGANQGSVERTADSVVNRVDEALQAFAPPSSSAFGDATAVDVATELEPADADPVWSAVAQLVERELPVLAQRLGLVPLAVRIRIEPHHGDDPLMNCAGARIGPSSATIRCDQRFLRDAEAVMRLLHGRKDVFFADEPTRAFARKMRRAAADHVEELRRADELAGRNKHMTLHLRLFLTFVTAHELGHLIEGDEGSAFISAPGPQGVADAAAHATVKLCRHANDFVADGFRLPGLTALVGPESQYARISEAFRRSNAEYEDLVARRFVAERLADAYATDIVLEALAAAGRPDEPSHRHVLLHTMFTYALWEWYRNLSEFEDEVCHGALVTSAQLTVCLGLLPDAELRAERVFGDAHGFVALRALRLFHAVMAERTGYIRGKPEERTLWLRRGELDALDDEAAERRVDEVADAQSFELLRLLIDTPMKFAFTGCIAGTARTMRVTPFMLLMTFDPIEAELRRLTRLP